MTFKDPKDNQETLVSLNDNKLVVEKNYGMQAKKVGIDMSLRIPSLPLARIRPL